LETKSLVIARDSKLNPSMLSAQQASAPLHPHCADETTVLSSVKNEEYQIKGAIANLKTVPTRNLHRGPGTEVARMLGNRGSSHGQIDFINWCILHRNGVF